MTRSKSSITKRWVVNTLCVIVVVLIGVTLVLLLLFREQYYGAVRATLDARATGLVRSYFSFSSGTPTEESFNMRANEYVENFNDKTLMEVWVIGSDGSVVVSSSGFSVAGEPFPDYEEALVSENGILDRLYIFGRACYGAKLYACSAKRRGRRSTIYHLPCRY